MLKGIVYRMLIIHVLLCFFAAVVAIVVTQQWAWEKHYRVAIVGAPLTALVTAKPFSALSTALCSAFLWWRRSALVPCWPYARVGALKHMAFFTVTDWLLSVWLIVAQSCALSVYPLSKTTAGLEAPLIAVTFAVLLECLIPFFASPYLLIRLRFTWRSFIKSKEAVGLFGESGHHYSKAKMREDNSGDEESCGAVDLDNLDGVWHGSWREQDGRTKHSKKRRAKKSKKKKKAKLPS